MASKDDLYQVVNVLLKELDRDLISTIKARDCAGTYKDELAQRAIDIETRISEASKLEQMLRRAP